MENRMNWKFNWKHVSIVGTCVSANIEFISLFSLLGQCREGKHQINKSKYRAFFLFFHWKKFLYCTEQNLICPVLMNMKPTWSCSSILRCNEKLPLFSRNLQHYCYLTSSWSGINWPIIIDLEGMRLIYTCRESGLLLWKMTLVLVAPCGEWKQVASVTDIQHTERTSWYKTCLKCLGCINKCCFIAWFMARCSISRKAEYGGELSGL